AAREADSAGTLQVNGTFANSFHPVQCLAGTPATTNCYRELSDGDAFVPGLGKVTMDYTLAQDDFGSACGHMRAQMAIIDVVKGEIDLATRSNSCIFPDNPARFHPIEATGSGGSGLHADASDRTTLVN